MFLNCKNTKAKVTYLLETYPHLRDSDNKLIATFWKYEYPDPLNTIKADKFLYDYAHGKLTSAEVIRRTRQILQEKNINLRGESYLPRQRKSEYVRQTIKSDG